jgi:hypothetical protein
MLIKSKSPLKFSGFFDLKFKFKPVDKLVEAGLRPACPQAKAGKCWENLHRWHLCKFSRALALKTVEMKVLDLF